MATSPSTPASPPNAPDRLDIIGGTPSVALPGTSRYALIAGIPCVSTDGGLFLPVLGGVRAEEAALAQSLVGRGTQGLAFLFHHTAQELANQQTLQVTGSGVPLAIAGSYRLSTGASASTVIQGGVGHDSTSFAVGFPVSQPWFVTGRFAVTTAVTAQTRAHVGLCDSTGTPSLSAGIVGATSAAFFSLTGTSGAPIITTIPFDNAKHTHRAWRVGGTSFYQIDGGQIFTGSADIGSASGVFFQLTNGTDLVNRIMEIVFYGGGCLLQ